MPCIPLSSCPGSTRASRPRPPHAMAGSCPAMTGTGQRLPPLDVHPIALGDEVAAGAGQPPCDMVATAACLPMQDGTAGCARKRSGARWIAAPEELPGVPYSLPPSSSALPPMRGEADLVDTVPPVVP